MFSRFPWHFRKDQGKEGQGGGHDSARRVSHTPCCRQAHRLTQGPLRFLTVPPNPTCARPHIRAFRYLSKWPNRYRYPVALHCCATILFEIITFLIQKPLNHVTVIADNSWEFLRGILSCNSNLLDKQGNCNCNGNQVGRPLKAVTVIP